MSSAWARLSPRLWRNPTPRVEYGAWVLRRGPGSRPPDTGLGAASCPGPCGGPKSLWRRILRPCSLPPRSSTRTLALAKFRRSVVSRTRSSSRLETLPCPRVIVGSVVPWAHDVAIQEVLVQPHVLAGQLPPPKEIGRAHV